MSPGFPRASIGSPGALDQGVETLRMNLTVVGVMCAMAIGGAILLAGADAKRRLVCPIVLAVAALVVAAAIHSALSVIAVTVTIVAMLLFHRVTNMTSK